MFSRFSLIILLFHLLYVFVLVYIFASVFKCMRVPVSHKLGGCDKDNEKLPLLSLQMPAILDSSGPKPKNKQNYISVANPAFSISNAQNISINIILSDIITTITIKTSQQLTKNSKAHFNLAMARICHFSLLKLCHAAL